MIIENFKPFIGQHCETTATGSLLNQIGVELSEPMLFGIGEGLNFIFWNMKMMDYPFIGGRIKPDVLTENICRNLDLRLEARETSSVQTIKRRIVSAMSVNSVAGLIGAGHGSTSVNGKQSALLPFRASLTAASRVPGRTPIAFASAFRTRSYCRGDKAANL